MLPPGKQVCNRPLFNQYALGAAGRAAGHDAVSQISACRLRETVIFRCGDARRCERGEVDLWDGATRQHRAGGSSCRNDQLGLSLSNKIGEWCCWLLGIDWKRRGSSQQGCDGRQHPLPTVTNDRYQLTNAEAGSSPCPADRLAQAAEVTVGPGSVANHKRRLLGLLVDDGTEQIHHRDLRPRLGGRQAGGHRPGDRGQGTVRMIGEDGREVLKAPGKSRNRFGCKQVSAEMHHAAVAGVGLLEDKLKVVHTRLLRDWETLLVQAGKVDCLGPVGK